MNIHEHQAKDLLKEFEIPVPKGFVIYDVEEITDRNRKVLWMIK